jgi:DNA-binding ferritin-like protein (Dps family)
MINFLAEISIKNDEIYILPTPTNDYQKYYNVYELYISKPWPFSYWLDWGGYYDNFVGTNIEIYYERFLSRVETLNEVLTQDYSFYLKDIEYYLLDCGYADNNSADIYDCIFNNNFDCFNADNNSRVIDLNNSIYDDIMDFYDSGDAREINVDYITNIFDGGYAGENYSENLNKIVLLNVPKHTWLYPDYSVANRKVKPFLSSALDPDNPSYLTLRGDQSYTKLETPNISVKLSENINGISLNQGFNISLINNDGFFDDDIEWNLFNSPISIKKSTKDIPKYEDFIEIRSGFVDDVGITFDKINITASDKFKSMNEPVCNIIRKENFIIIITNIDEKAIGKFIPVIYGTKKVKLIKLNDTSYIGAEYISYINGIYDRDGNEVNGTYNPSTNIITVLSGDADSAIITGYTDNRIGAIIKEIAVNKSFIPYGPTNWNIEEIERYILNSPKINIAFTSGDVTKAIQEVLKSDVAYFIQQMDGKLTIRRYGELYKEHTIPTWVITKKPEKVYTKAMENYFSSCIINYNFINDDTYNSFLYDKLENYAEFTYNKKLHRIFDTDLIQLNDVEVLANILGKRYIKMKQSIKVSLGIDTSNMELLDTVKLSLDINDRNFSNVSQFIIKEINPAQDMLTLEEI